MRLDAPLKLDGRLDEAVYGAHAPIATRLIQVEPDAGQPSTEKTEAWVFFDKDNVYVSLRCWDSHPERMVVNELRRDNFNIANNENVGFGFDTFHDRRNGVTFNVTPAGARMDGEVADERTYNGDWNPVWTASAGRFEGGWIVEAAVPFKSLRYGPGREQIWGFQLSRIIRHKNERTYMTPLPVSYAQRGMFMWSQAATLVGIEAPENSRRLEVRPYGLTSLTTEKAVRPAIANEPDVDAGIDAKIGLTQNLTADLTLNTDFAQVEADDQQINLTRFNLFFPEKRDFFLENQGLFSFGGTGGLTGGGGGDAPTLFYSRRIGLSQGQVVPLLGGGRLTGRLGGFSVGALGIRTNDVAAARAPATTFAVVRVKRDVFRRSSVGLLAAHRSIGEGGTGANDTYGVDGTFAFLTNIAVNTYWARTRSPGASSDAQSYRAQFDYSADRYGAQLEHLAVGAGFNPEVGFVRRADMHKTYGLFRFSPRPKQGRVRKYSLTNSVSYVENGAGRLDTREFDSSFGIEFQSSDRLNVSFGDTYEFLPAPFSIAAGVAIPTGGYRYDNGRVAWTFGEQRRAAATISIESGAFYNGHRTTLGIGGGRVELTPRLSLQPTVSVNWVDLQQGRFTSTVVGSRVTYGISPLMFASALVQYNSSSRTLAANVRLRWEYQPGSELFVVLNETRSTLGEAFPDLANRAVIVKINRLLRF